MAKLSINRGTTYTRTVSVKIDGEPADLTGATVRFTVKANEYDTDAGDTGAAIRKDITTGTAEGTCEIVLDPADTANLTPGKYFYDAKLALPDGRVFKLDEGTIKLDGSPTNRLS